MLVMLVRITENNKFFFFFCSKGTLNLLKQKFNTETNTRINTIGHST